MLDGLSFAASLLLHVVLFLLDRTTSGIYVSAASLTFYRKNYTVNKLVNGSNETTFLFSDYGSTPNSTYGTTFFLTICCVCNSS